MQDLLERANSIAIIYNELHTFDHVDNQKAELKSLTKVAQLLEEVSIEICDPTEFKKVQTRDLNVMWDRLLTSTSEAVHAFGFLDDETLSNHVNHALRTATAMIDTY